MSSSSSRRCLVDIGPHPRSRGRCSWLLLAFIISRTFSTSLWVRRMRRLSRAWLSEPVLKRLNSSRICSASLIRWLWLRVFA
ncbi:hypothetical protein BKA60DRAFT_200396 [Fusarium oxysporum]|nr:hypothetical protein BKA60DRAFT_200396 [Fusarium oxysporum]